MSVSQLLSTVWSALRGTLGGGQDFVVVYTALGAILWAFLLFKVFLQEGLQVATGHHSELPKILVKYLFVAGMFAIWPEASSSIFSAVSLLATTFYPNLDSLLDTMASSMGFAGLVSTVLGTLYNFTLGSLFVLIGMIVLFLCYALILINIAGSLTILTMNLVLGPVFFALSFDRDFRGHAQKWFAAVLSYFMLIPLYGAALTVAAAIAGAAVPANLFGLPSSAQILAQIIGPLMADGSQPSPWKRRGSFHDSDRPCGSGRRWRCRPGHWLQDQFHGTVGPG